MFLSKHIKQILINLSYLAHENLEDMWIGSPT